MCLLIIAPAHGCLHGARLRMSSRSRKVFRLPRLLLFTPTPTSHTQYLGTLFENIYLSGRKEECVLSSSRLLTDASMELASRCHLCRARSSGSQGSSLPPLPLPTHSTSVTLLDNLYLSMRRDECVSSSSRLLTDAFMELASTRDLDRARFSGSKDPFYPHPDLPHTVPRDSF